MVKDCWYRCTNNPQDSSVEIVIYNSYNLVQKLPFYIFGHQNTFKIPPKLGSMRQMSGLSKSERPINLTPIFMHVVFMERHSGGLETHLFFVNQKGNL